VSSGAALHAALQLAAAEPAAAEHRGAAADTGERYLSTILFANDPPR